MEQTEFEKAAENLIHYAYRGLLNELKDQKNEITVVDANNSMEEVLQWGLITGLIEGEDTD